ncbi:type II secretion system protein GspE, partial [Achromobacter xylosoxidans]|nr:type II secretion system protein GspE [Achromobacter xylosoxidans]
MNARDASPRHKLPYAWARQHRALLQWQGGGVGELIITDQTPAWAVIEARRRHGPMALRRAADAEFDGLLAAAYADAGDAASVVGAAEN